MSACVAWSQYIALAAVSAGTGMKVAELDAVGGLVAEVEATGQAG